MLLFKIVNCFFKVLFCKVTNLYCYHCILQLTVFITLFIARITTFFSEILILIK
jgi:hypothetical protein